jgi:hypothetical protein
MKRSWWLRVRDRYRGDLWPVRYRIDGSTWWSWRGRQFLYREARSDAA